MNLAAWRRLSYLPIFGLALALGLSACIGLDTTPGTQATISINSTPDSLSPTPTAPPYLVGAYVSNSTVTNGNGSIIVYVIFHHGQQPQAGGKASLYFHYNEDGGGISGLNNQAGTQTTGSDGYATFSIGIRGLQLNTPIGIDVTVRFPGIPNIVKANAASFSVVSSAPTNAPTPTPTP